LVLVVCGLLSALFAPIAVNAQTLSGGEPLLNGSLVDIGGGRRMNIVCTGHGAPTVVFDYGIGGNILTWQNVAAPVSAMTRACFYDRAGYGGSDPSGRPMTADNVTDDLHALLHNAGVSGPFVLTGHSIAGLYATLYADKFPSQVAGLVLIDPSFANQETPDWSAEERQQIKTEFDRVEANTMACEELARSQKLSQSEPHGCFQLGQARTPAESTYLVRQFVKPFRYESALSEMENHSGFGMDEDSLEELKAARSFGDRPVIVLTGTTYPPDPYETAAMEKTFYGHWKTGHDRLAARSTRGQSIVVPNAGHAIQLDQPQAVIDAISTVVLEVRKSDKE
jgi:pimeloyl-ACP methyl ester carboxylesterase